ncbi:SAG-related sequence [Besnoitia besnoiti]|uniref:SAG-related sequence n=1 Tax=Besnoitia besnoiti TaxID=94643 RepID=A0A2A9MNU5_BESBE|nr:SAG-related sequence [Besnoitia besnoiti]PFH37946.1 SAG-related sequence [Besnoitia besnoiti]
MKVCHGIVVSLVASATLTLSTGYTATVTDLPVLSQAAAATAVVSKDQTCSSLENRVTLTIEADRTDATFKCGDSFPALKPKDCGKHDDCVKSKQKVTDDQEKKKICKDEYCIHVVQLREVFPRATRTDKPDTHTHTLSIPIDKRAPTIVWYHCEDTDKQQSCKVQIRVKAPASAPPPPPSNNANTCEKDGHVSKLTALHEYPIKFICGPGRVLQPLQTTHV